VTNVLAYLFIALTIAFTVYGQLILKWQVGVDPSLNLATSSPKGLLLGILVNPWVLSAFAAAFAASLCWMAALGKLPLSKAYPFMALSFPIVAVFAVLLFREELNAPKVIGTSLIVLGAIVLSRAPA